MRVVPLFPKWSDQTDDIKTKEYANTPTIPVISIKKPEMCTFGLS